MEQGRRVWNTLETTVSYKARARLTPTLTHVVTYELVTSGAEDRAMSGRTCRMRGCRGWDVGVQRRDTQDAEMQGQDMGGGTRMQG